jgi:hypothetical protein
MLDAVSSRLAACCSVRADNSWLPRTISLDAVSMAPVAVVIWPTIEVSCSTVPLALRHIWPNSPWNSSLMPAVRSPSDRALSSRCTSTTACFCSVMSMAYLTTLNGLPSAFRIGLYDDWIHTSRPPLPTRLYWPTS